MAPMALDNIHPLKRSSSTADFDIPFSKKQQFQSLRLHRPAYPPNQPIDKHSSCQDEPSIQALLSRSIGLALETVGFESADPVAVESFRAEAEEYMSHFLSDVRQCMLSSRRTQPIPQDFLQALHSHQLSLRALIPHLDPPVPSSRSQIVQPLEPDYEIENHHPSFLGSALSGELDRQGKPYVPMHMPQMPSKHTYRFTAEYTERETDPRKIREKATEEGRLGEEALRRLVGAASHAETAIQTGARGMPKSMRTQRDDLWKETMEAVADSRENEVREMEERRSGKQKETTGGGFISNRGRLSSAVNAENKYWRKAIQGIRSNQGKELYPV